MAISFNDNLDLRAPKLVDNRSAIFENGKVRPYNSLEEAYEKIPSQLRAAGLGVYIKNAEGKSQQYWFQYEGEPNVDEVLRLFPVVEATAVDFQVFGNKLSKTDWNLDQVDNTRDIDKPVSTAQKSALDQAIESVRIPDYDRAKLADLETQEETDARLAQKVNIEEGKSLVENTQIQKLASLDTQQELDYKFSQVVVGEKGSIGVSDVAPTVDGIYRAKEAGTYTNLGGLVVSPGDSVWFKREAGLWAIYSEISNTVATGKIRQGETSAPSGDTVYNHFPKLTVGKNLFNPSDINNNYYISIPSGGSTGGALVYAEGWICSGYIEATPGQYVISGTKGRTGVGFYNSGKTPIGYADVNLGLVTVPEGAAYMAINLKSPTTEAYSNVQVERGSNATTYQPYALVFGFNGVLGLPELADKVDNTYVKSRANEDKLLVYNKTTKQSSNLFDPSEESIVEGTLISEFSGTTTTAGVASNYNTTDFIKIKPNTDYIGININTPPSLAHIFRKIAFFDSNKQFISGIGATWYRNFTTPNNAEYVRVSVLHINSDGSPNYPMEGYGIFEGTTAEFEPFVPATDAVLADNNIALNQKVDNSIASIKNVKDLINRSKGEATKTVNYSYSGTLLTVEDENGNYISGTLNVNRGYTGNSMFNFYSYNVEGNTRMNGDDVAPVHILNTTLGANHGQPITNATVTGHGLTNISIGTEWLNSTGRKFYILRIVDGNTIAFISENTGTRFSPVFTALTTGVLTRDSQTLNVTAVAGSQVYPSIKNITAKVLENGTTEVGANSKGVCDFIDVVESYEIINAADILENIKSRAPEDLDPPVFEGESAMLIENIYRFVPNLSVVVMTNYKFLQPVAFQDVMGTQAIPIGTASNIQYYIPNSNPIPAGDFRKPLARTWNSSTPSAYVTNANMPEPENPPNRINQYINNTGFSIGYLPNRGVSKALNSYTARTFEIRNNTGKIYPHPVEGLKTGAIANVGDVYNSVLYRSFSILTKTRTSSRISFFNFPFEGREYVFVDYSGSTTDYINLENDFLNGKEIKVLESKNVILLTDTYNNGFYAKSNYIEGETSYMVLEIK